MRSLAPGADSARIPRDGVRQGAAGGSLSELHMSCRSQVEWRVRGRGTCGVRKKDGRGTGYTVAACCQRGQRRIVDKAYGGVRVVVLTRFWRMSGVPGSIFWVSSLAPPRRNMARLGHEPGEQAAAGSSPWWSHTRVITRNKISCVPAAVPTPGCPPGASRIRPPSRCHRSHATRLQRHARQAAHHRWTHGRFCIISDDSYCAPLSGRRWKLGCHS